MGDESENDRHSLARLADLNATFVGAFSAEAFDSLSKALASGARKLELKGRGAWPEFIFRGTVISVDIDSWRRLWYVEEVSMDGLVLQEVVEKG